MMMSNTLSAIGWGFFLGCLAIIPNLALMPSEIATN